MRERKTGREDCFVKRKKYGRRKSERAQCGCSMLGKGLIVTVKLEIKEMKVFMLTYE